jgi:hypothetical protein
MADFRKCRRGEEEKGEDGEVQLHVDSSQVESGVANHFNRISTTRPCVLRSANPPSMTINPLSYFTDGAVIGSKAFVNEAFAGAR